MRLRNDFVFKLMLLFVISLAWVTSEKIDQYSKKSMQECRDRELRIRQSTKIITGHKINVVKENDVLFQIRSDPHYIEPWLEIQTGYPMNYAATNTWLISKAKPIVTKSKDGWVIKFKEDKSK